MAAVRQTDKCGYALGTWWRPEKKRTSKKDMVTNIAGRFARDESQQSWQSG